MHGKLVASSLYWYPFSISYKPNTLHCHFVYCLAACTTEYLVGIISWMCGQPIILHFLICFVYPYSLIYNKLNKSKNHTRPFLYYLLKNGIKWEILLLPKLEQPDCFHLPCNYTAEFLLLSSYRHSPHALIICNQWMSHNCMYWNATVELAKWFLNCDSMIINSIPFIWLVQPALF